MRNDSRATLPVQGNPYPDEGKALRKPCAKSSHTTCTNLPESAIDMTFSKKCSCCGAGASAGVAPDGSHFPIDAFAT